jgi:kynurenine formamidase
MPKPVNRAAIYEAADKLSNWGRWGQDDQIGTLNNVSPEDIVSAAKLIRKGKSFALGLSLKEPIQSGLFGGRWNPIHTMLATGTDAIAGRQDWNKLRYADDAINMPVQAATHWDSLAHVSWRGVLWNGHPAASVTAERGATRCGIDKVGTLVTRGVLLDVARAKGVERLEPGYAIVGEDLDAACEHAGLRIEPGDAVLVRTGQMTLLPRHKRDYYFPSPGPSVGSVEWFRRHDVAAVATDNITFEAYPTGHDGVGMPVHALHLVEIGLTQGQNFVLEALADDCAADGVYEFLLEASPQPFVGGLGSPVNPVAVK